MSELLAALREEIRKQTRKEIRASLDKTKKLVANHRREIAQLKKLLQDANKRISFLEGCERERLKKGETSTAGTLRFSAKSVRTHRTRLGFSAAEYGKLLGVAAQTIYQWERGSSRPRKSQLAVLAQLRTIGKKEARERLRLLIKRDDDSRAIRKK